MTTPTPPARAEVPPPPPPMIEVTNGSKWFGDLVAVSDVSFTVGRGVTALLGPNGAGKSTLLRMLSGQAAPSSGQVRVLGRDPRSDLELSRLVGLVPQQENLFDMLSGFEFVHLAARLNDVEDPVGQSRQVLATVELDPDDDRKLSTYSKGMRQRIKLAQALVHGPQVLMLDEPLTGLDPRQRLQMIRLFHQLGEQGRCILVSSHVLDEVQRIGSNVLVIAQGRMAAEGDFQAIRALMDDRPFRVRVRAADVRRLAVALLGAEVVDGVHLTGEHELMIDASDGSLFASQIARVARAADVSLHEVRVLDDDLESVFRYLVER